MNKLRQILLFAIVFTVINTTGRIMPVSIASNASGNWNATATWVGGVVPTIADSVSITAGHTITVTQSTSCLSIIFNSTNKSTTSIISINDNSVLNVVGSVFAPHWNNAIANNGSYQISGSGTLICGTINVGNQSEPATSGTTVVTFIMSVDTLRCTNVNLYSRVSAQAGKINNPALDFQGGNIFISGQIFTDNSAAAGCTSTVTTANATSACTVNLTGAVPFNFSASGTNIINLTNALTTFNYGGDVTQTIYPTSYGNLQLSGTGSKTITSGISVTGAYSVSGGTTATGTSPTVTGSTTVEYNGSSPTITGTELPSTVTIIRINTTAGVTLGKPVTATSIYVGDQVPNSIFTDGGNAITTTNLYLNSGTLNIHSSTFPTVSGTQTMQPGFTIAYIGNGAQTAKNSFSYYNLTLGGSNVKTTSGITVNGTLSMQGAASVSVQPTYAAGAVIEYAGSSAQTTSIEFPSSFPNLKINNAAGVALNEAKTVSGTLTMSNGKLSLGNNDLTVTGTVSGADATKYFVTNGTGKLKQSVGTSARSFHIGRSASFYNPVTLQLASGTDDFSINTTQSSQYTINSVESTVKNSWTISRLTSTGGNVNVTLQWNNPTQAGSTFSLLSQVVIAKNSGSGWSATNVTPVDLGSGNYSAIASFSTFSDFIVGNQDGPLPVELVSFKSVVKGTTVTLKWNTATEVDNYGFDIERSVINSGKAQNWEKIGFVQGAGNSNSPKEYSYSDKNLAGGKYMYRLKQVDTDGTFDYSPEVEGDIVIAPAAFALNQNYPNPFNPSTVITYQLPENSFVELQIYDILGNLISSLVNESQEKGIYEVEFNATGLSGGIYLCRLNAEGNGTRTFSAVKKLTLLK